MARPEADPQLASERRQCHSLSQFFEISRHQQIELSQKPDTACTVNVMSTFLKAFIEQTYADVSNCLQRI